MRVLNIAMRAAFTEGYTYQDNLLTEYQHKLGHEVILLTTTKCRGEDGKITSVPPCDMTMDNGVRLIRITPGNKYAQILGYYGSVKNIIKCLKPDLIFIHGLCNFIPYQAILYKKCRMRTILVADNHQDVQNSKTKGFPFSQLLFIWRMCWKKWIKYFNHIYGTTTWRKDFMIEYFGIPQRKAEILMLGADTDKFPERPLELRKSIRHELKIAETDMVYIHGGKMNKDKRTLDVIRAFKSICQDNISLILFGSVADDIKVDFYKEIKHHSSIKYIGYIDSGICHKYFFASDFAVFPGLHSVLWEESVACGLPGVYGRYGSNDHINVCGNCIQVDLSASTSDISQIMKKINSDSEYFTKLKIAANKASKIFSYTNIALKSIRP